VLTRKSLKVDALCATAAPFPLFPLFWAFVTDFEVRFVGR
jgi:hypothetical protein